MIKVSSRWVYERGDAVCAACGRAMGSDKYEKVTTIKLDKCDLALCEKCSHALKRILGNHLKGK